MTAVRRHDECTVFIGPGIVHVRADREQGFCTFDTAVARRKHQRGVPSRLDPRAHTACGPLELLGIAATFGPSSIDISFSDDRTNVDIRAVLR